MFPRSQDLVEFKRDIDKEVEEILAENSKVFGRKFEAIEISLRDVKVTIYREGDRVISELRATMNAGPHERIIDPVRLPVSKPRTLNHAGSRFRIFTTSGKKW